MQTTPDTLRIRLRVAEGADPPRVRESVRTNLTGLLSDHHLANVTVEPAEEPPIQTTGGKYPQVIPYKQ
ncbi:hypothetical protein ACIA5D_43380 [Actinoplanes sp. NPDC051513]|uniref:hypothetical protein n=1 Tax=Actinoplanes sp. NPDC051513 TaxID=3363908 RepID=UPI0037ACA416